jgi:hypothetical protein
MKIRVGSLNYLMGTHMNERFDSCTATSSKSLLRTQHAQRSQGRCTTVQPCATLSARRGRTQPARGK